MTIKLLSSPLQGFTDHIFRNSFNMYFGGIDKFYAPYIRLKGKLEIKASQQREINPDNNRNINLIPQMMTKRVEEFLFVAKEVTALGYEELNWNLGCPFPMVAKRGLGSGQITDIEGIDRILNDVFVNSDIKISIKTRLGYEDHDEIFPLLLILEKYPINNITIHPRIGKQLYKGKIDLDTFQKCLDRTNHKIIYNGDITSVEKFRELQNRYSSIDSWMVGRGIIANPFLPQMIKNEKFDFPSNKNEIFQEFHNELLENYSQLLSGDKHIIMKMVQFWEYFITIFPDSHKRLKKIKKSKNIREYEAAVKVIFDSE